MCKPPALPPTRVATPRPQARLEQVVQVWTLGKHLARELPQRERLGAVHGHLTVLQSCRETPDCMAMGGWMRLARWQFRVRNCRAGFSHCCHRTSGLPLGRRLMGGYSDRGDLQVFIHLDAMGTVPRRSRCAKALRIASRQTSAWRYTALSCDRIIIPSQDNAV